MCLRDQGIDDDGGGVARVRWAHEISDKDGGVGRGQGIDDASEGSETTTEASRIQGRQRRLRRRDDRPEELETMKEALTEKDYPEVSTTTTKASAGEEEQTTRPSERLQ